MQKTFFPRESPSANECETVLLPDPSIPTIAIVQQRRELVGGEDLVGVVVGMAFAKLEYELAESHMDRDSVA